MTAIQVPQAKAAVTSSSLVLHLDAGRKTSYPGSGTTWTDLNGAYNGTLTNGPGYLATNGKAIDFDGVDDHVVLPTLTTNFSTGFSATFYADFGTAKTWGRVLDFGNGNQSNNILVSRSGGSNDFWFEAYGAPTSAALHDAITLGHCTVTDALLGGGWHHWAITFASGVCHIYKDNVEQNLTNTFAANSNLNNISRTTNYLAKSNWTGDQFFDGAIGEISIYNKALSAAEVTANYNVEKESCSPTTTTSGLYTIVKFTEMGTCIWTRPAALPSAEALIVAGGGGGGFDVAGGGGAGGLLYYGSENPKAPNGAALSFSQETFTVVVGGGGVGSTSVSTTGGNGEDSSFNSYVATGGGYGNSRNLTSAAGSGGSGGGGGFSNGSGNGVNPGSGSSGQGNNGGTASVSADSGAGGGGAGGVGANRSGSSTTGAEGKGGDGLQYSITGTATYYAGGGGGGAYNSVGGKGGLGGGGHGGNATLATCNTIVAWTDCGSTEVSGREGKPGQPNTGGGGGGSGNEGTTNYPGAGGSGIVILKYLTIYGTGTVSLSITGTLKKLSSNTITATVNTPGRVTFYTNGRLIPRCSNIATTGSSPNYTAVCTWKPITQGAQNISTSFAPDNAGYSSASKTTTGQTTKRTTAR
jgi:hypothetical protein